MAKLYPEITPELREWISHQQMFFVATAPLAGEGHVNCSPKGGDTFRILGPREVVYADLSGSGAETAAHLRENGRIVIMFCAFTGGPKVARLHGRGSVIELHDPGFSEMRSRFGELKGLRALIHIDVTRISDSCGYAVPLYDFVAPRDVLDKWCDAKGPTGLVDYRAQKNRVSIDGLPALKQF